MHNIKQIVKEDFKKLSSSAISLLVVIGLVCIPSIYSWLNLCGCWDPYKNTSDLKVAVVNKDQGFKSQYLPMDINVGNQTVNALYQNPDFKWVFVEDENEALDDLNNRKYYACLVIPCDFSDQIMSVLSNKAENAQLIYFSNEKENAIAPKITGQGANNIQVKINNTFQDTLLEAMLKIMTTAADAVQSQDSKLIMTNMSNTFASVSDSMKGSAAQLKSVKTTISALNELINTTNDVLPVSGSAKEQELRDILNTIAKDLNLSKDALNKLAEYMKEKGMSEHAQQVVRDIANLVINIESINNSAIAIMDDVANASGSLHDTLASIKALTNNLDNQLSSVIADFNLISDDLSAAKLKIDGLSNSSTVDDLRKIIGEDTDRFAVLLTQPVQLDRTAIYPVRDNGSAMAAFCTSLSIWVGPLLLGAMMKVNISEKRLRKMKKVKLSEMYFGRYIIFGVLSALQATLVSLGNLCFLQIQCVHPLLFMFTAWIMAFVFSFLIYTLVVSFANAGKAIAVILLVLQVAGSGGIFPHEMIHPFFAQIYPYLPFSWSIEAFHYCIAGFNPTTGLATYIALVMLPALILVPLSLLLGLVLRVPIIRFNKWFVGKLEQTEVLG